MGIDNRLNIKENDAVELANGELYHVGRVYDDGSIEGGLIEITKDKGLYWDVDYKDVVKVWKHESNL